MPAAATRACIGSWSSSTTGGMIIDTPGMRELQLWDVDEAIDETFADIAALARRLPVPRLPARPEPGCAVKARGRGRRARRGPLRELPQAQPRAAPPTRSGATSARCSTPSARRKIGARRSGAQKSRERQSGSRNPERLHVRPVRQLRRSPIRAERRPPARRRTSSRVQHDAGQPPIRPSSSSTTRRKRFGDGAGARRRVASTCAAASSSACSARTAPARRR